jgi:hypothetical protein
MDANCQKNSWSACQLAIMHRNYQKHLKNLLYLPEAVDSAYDLFIPGGLGEVHWDAPHDLVGNVHIGEGTTLHLDCAVTAPSGARFYPESRVVGLERVSKR